jgi:hypothetical protein
MKQKPKQNAEAKETRIARLLETLEKAEQGFSLHRDDFERWKRAYDGDLDYDLAQSLRSRNKSSVIVQKIKAKVLAVKKSIDKNFYANERLILISAIDKNDEERVSVAERLQERLEVWTQQQASVRDLTGKNILDALIFGTSIARVYWHNDMPTIEHCEIDSVWFDPDANNFANISYLVHNVKTTFAAIANFAAFDKEVLDEIAASLGDAPATSYPVEIQDVYTKDEEGWKVSTFFERGKPLRIDDKLKDGLPFICGYIRHKATMQNEVTTRVYGDSLVSVMEALQLAINARENQRLDAVDEQLNPRFLATTASGLSEAAIVTRRRKLEVNDLNAVQPMPQPNVQAAFLEIDALDTELQEVSGVVKFSQGLGGDSLDRTATGVSIRTQETNEQIEQYIQAFSETFFEPLARRAAQLFYRYGTDFGLANIDRDPPFRFWVNVNAGIGAANRQTRLNGLTQSIAVLQPLIQAYANLGDQTTVQALLDANLKLAIETFTLNGIKNASDYLDYDEIKKQKELANGNYDGSGSDGDINGILGVAQELPIS